MADNSSGILRVVSPSDLAAQERADGEMAYAAQQEAKGANPSASDLRQYIGDQWALMRDHRSTSGLGDRLLNVLRIFNGKYDPAKLAEIAKFGGSQVYSRIVGTKTRGATALLRAVYFGSSRVWGLAPTPHPTTPNDINAIIEQVVAQEAETLVQAGQMVTADMVQMRKEQLMSAAADAARRGAEAEAKAAEDRLDDYLVEGQFYDALSEFLVDLPLFPFAVIKGPVVRMVEDVTWVEGQAVLKKKPQLFWRRVSPFDFYWTPGVSNIQEANVCERLRWTRRDLMDLLGLPGWDEDAVRGALADYDHGLRDWLDNTDSSRAYQEGREDPNFNRSNMIDALEFHGTASGKKLLDTGIPPDQISDPDLEYSIQAWICGDYVLKLQINPNPRKQHPYRVTSYEKVPGTPIGNAVPDMISDIEDVANAAFRALVNNMAMASGPQVVLLTDRMDPSDTNQLYPWKHWSAVSEPGQAASPPVAFFQPSSNAAELLGIYQKMTEMADENSAIPRYITGSGATGGAGRTASGLSMLMGNASKMIQQVAANIDIDVFYKTIEGLYDLLMLVGGEGAGLRGDESIVVRGVSTVMAREAERARQLEFLQLTANPIDLQIVGLDGRAELLRSISEDLGLPSDRIVPSPEARKEAQAQALQAQHAQMQAEGQPDQSGSSQGIQTPGPANSTSPIENTVQPGFKTGGVN